MSNKYTNWYYNIVNTARSRNLPADVYTETHHIVPKSLGGDNSKNNFVSMGGGKSKTEKRTAKIYLFIEITSNIASTSQAVACCGHR